MNNINWSVAAFLVLASNAFAEPGVLLGKNISIARVPEPSALLLLAVNLLSLFVVVAFVRRTRTRSSNR